jgi:NAD(P)-dependent dehydrogenase (short-subunit alcohol dehydrogenase family)
MGDACKGRVALVTGASRGIGKAIALRLAAEGARVAVVARSLRPEDHELDGSLEETVAAIRAGGREAHPIVADLSNPDDRGDLIASAEAAFGAGIDILVNNAAASFYVPFETFALRKARLLFEVNVAAPWELMQAVLPGMKTRGRGWILNISTAAVIPPSGPPYALSGNAIDGAAGYAGTKAMLNRVTQSVALEVFKYGIAANALAPEAGVQTEGAMAVMNLPDEMCEPIETMAEAALALCTCDPAKLTGRVAYSLSLLKELQRPVFSLDGRTLVAGWQPAEIPNAHLFSQKWSGA